MLGRIIETVTGSDIAEMLRKRVFDPAGMTATEYPETSAMPSGSLSGYLVNGGKLIDVTRYEPSIFSASGAVVSTVGDVNRFFRALLDGTLLRPAQVAAVREVPASGYGLGVLAGGDACGVDPPELVYGQRGNGFGYRAISFSSPDGQRQVTLAWTATAVDPATDPLEQPALAALIAGLTATCR